MPAKRSKRNTKAKAAGALPEAAFHTLSSLEQIRTLADPLRVRILETLCEERTTKQVAGVIGEKPTKLYHHVEALERAGLIRLVRTRQNRGTLEKYYQAVARAFRADASLFPTMGESAGGHPMHRMISTLLEKTGAELRRVTSMQRGAKGLEEEGVFAFLEARGDEKEMRRLRRRMEKLAQGERRPSEKCCAGSGRRRFRMMIAFYPLDDPPK